MASHSVVHPAESELVAVLNTLRIRSLDSLFDTNKSPLDLGVLEEIVERHHDDLWQGDNDQKREAIRRTLLGAAEYLPNEQLSHTPVGSRVTWRSTAILLYELLPLGDGAEVRLRQYKKGQRHAKLAELVRELSGFSAGDEAFKDVILRIRKQLAIFLLSEEARKGTDQMSESIGRTLGARSTSGADPDSAEAEEKSARSSKAKYHFSIQNVTHSTFGDNAVNVYFDGYDDPAAFVE